MNFVYLNGTDCGGYAAYDMEAGRITSMTVGELIAKLSTMPQDAAVIAGSAYHDFVVSGVTATETSN